MSGSRNSSSPVLKFLLGPLALGGMLLTGCAFIHPGDSSSAGSSSSDSTPVDNSASVSNNDSDTSNAAAQAMQAANDQAAADAATAAAQAQNNAAQADAIQTEINANNAPPPQ